MNYVFKKKQKYYYLIKGRLNADGASDMIYHVSFDARHGKDDFYLLIAPFIIEKASKCFDFF